MGLFTPGFGRGEIADNLVGLEVVLSNGGVIQTGGAAWLKPFWRQDRKRQYEIGG